MAERDAWGDWRTDTAERPLPAVLADAHRSGDETRTMAPVPAVVEPSADLPRPPRFPLYADDLRPAPVVRSAPTAAPAAPTTAPGPSRRLRPLVPWVVAAAVVALAAGTAGTVVATRPDPLTAVGTGDVGALPAGPSRTVVGDRTDGAASPGATDPGERRTGSSRGGEARPDEEPADRVSRRDARPVAAAVTAPRTAPPNVDLSGERVTYDATNLLDGRPETAWRVAGNARDTVLTVRLDRPTVITTVGLLNGYAKAGTAGDRAVDWYDANRRVRRVEWFFDDGSRVVQSLREVREVQRTDIRPTETSTVRVRIAAVSAPGRGRDGRDYTAVSEIALEGVPVDDAPDDGPDDGMDDGGADRRTTD
ncbi:hypothetical protein GCM10009737_12040 [Nocardioides lentus]|uniref:NAD glycohydrolase translocation F5/8 type C domain-containing protein n=1 Tax=Nocardioides lentus TaxID=338077 RepID=A0ABN2P651_9ACTN